MALYKSLSGGLSETVLWTNSQPSQSITSDTALTLSESMDNYKYLKFTYKVNTTSNIEVSTIMSVEDIKKCVGGANSPAISISATKESSGYTYMRKINQSAGSLSLGRCFGFNFAQEDGSLCILLNIYGLK